MDHKRPHLAGRNLSFKIAMQLQIFLPSSSFCIVCILLFPPIHITVSISLVLKCKEYIFGPISPFVLYIFLIDSFDQLRGNMGDQLLGSGSSQMPGLSPPLCSGNPLVVLCHPPH